MLSSSVSTSMRRPLWANDASRQHRTQRRHQPVGDVSRAGMIVIVRLRQHAASADTPERITSIGSLPPAALRAWRAPQPAIRAKPSACSYRRLVRPGSAAPRAPEDARSPRTRGFRRRRECAAAIMQIVAGPSDGTERRVTGGDTGQRDGFLRRSIGACRLIRHDELPMSRQPKGRRRAGRLRLPIKMPVDLLPPRTEGSTVRSNRPDRPASASATVDQTEKTVLLAL